MTDNPVLQEILRNRPPLPDVDGYIWVQMLVKYNIRTGNAEIIRSFSKPAADSLIKKFVKPKKPRTVIPTIENAVNKEESLF